VSPSWKAASHSVIEGFSQHFMEPEGSLPCSLSSILNQNNSVHTTSSYFSKIHFNIILQPTSSSFLLPFLPKSCVHSFSRHACYMPCSSHPPSLDHSNYTLRRVQVMKLIMQVSPISRHFISLRSKYSPQHPFLTLSLCFSLNVRDRVPQPYRTTGKIIVLHILIFTFLDSRQEDERFWTELQQALPEFNLLLISS
jgi:hypothetical protein